MYVEELVARRNISHLCCKSCGHTFHGNATRIKEHLFNVGVNVNGCSSPPGDIHVHLNKYVAKLKAGTSHVKKKAPQGIRCGVSSGCTLESMQVEEKEHRDDVSPFEEQHTFTQNSHATSNASSINIFAGQEVTNL